MVFPRRLERIATSDEQRATVAAAHAAAKRSPLTVEAALSVLATAAAHTQPAEQERETVADEAAPSEPVEEALELVRGGGSERA